MNCLAKIFFKKSNFDFAQIEVFDFDITERDLQFDLTEYDMVESLTFNN